MKLITDIRNAGVIALALYSLQVTLKFPEYERDVSTILKVTTALDEKSFHTTSQRYDIDKAYPEQAADVLRRKRSLEIAKQHLRALAFTSMPKIAGFRDILKAEIESELALGKLVSRYIFLDKYDPTYTPLAKEVYVANLKWQTKGVDRQNDQSAVMSGQWQQMLVWITVGGILGLVIIIHLVRGLFGKNKDTASEGGLPNLQQSIAVIQEAVAKRDEMVASLEEKQSANLISIAEAQNEIDTFIAEKEATRTTIATLNSILEQSTIDHAAAMEQQRKLLYRDHFDLQKELTEEQEKERTQWQSATDIAKVDIEVANNKIQSVCNDNDRLEEQYQETLTKLEANEQRLLELQKKLSCLEESQ